MSGIPAGLESSSESDGELFYCGEDPNEFLKKLEKDIDFSNETSNVPLNFNRDDVGDGSKTENNGKSYGKVNRDKRQMEKFRFSPALLDDLRYAILQDNIDLMKELIEKGIEIDTVLKSGWTSLMYACSLGQPQMVEYLLSKGANANFHKDLFTPLMAVCASQKDEKFGLLQCTKLLLEHGARVNVWDRHHMTPLMFAARENHKEIVLEMIKQKTEINRQDNKGWTALCWAASKGNGIIVKIILEAHADAKKMTLNGQTASEIALSNGHDELSEILLSAEKNRNFVPDDKQLSVLNSQKSIAFKEFEAVNTKTKVYMGSEQIDFFLTGLSLSEWSKVFHYHEIKFEDFLLLSDKDLISMGVDKLGVRKTIIDGIEAVHKKKWERSSLPDIRNKKCISCPDAVVLMSNVGSHIQYMHSTVRYLRRQLQQQPRILELGQEQANVKRLLSEASLAFTICTNMKEELRFFERDLDKIQNNVELNPGDMIVERRRERRSHTPLIIAILGTTLVAILFGWRKPEYFRTIVFLGQPWRSCDS